MYTHNWTSRLGTCLLALLLVSCGGGGDTQTAGGGTGGTGISAGSITSFGSIFVNGVEFNTAGATYSRDGVTFTRNPGQLDSDILNIGMNVEVQGSITSSSGVANLVKVQETVRGPVEAISGSASAGTLVILDQTIQIDNNTIFGNSTGPALSFVSIAMADVLEVHGNQRADGSILASYVERKSAPIDFSVRGIVSAHDAAGKTFAVASPNGALNVNYANANISDMPAPSGSTWNGLLVQLKGSSCTGVIPDCGTLNATLVHPGGLGLSNASTAEVEGFVTTLVSGTDFTINSQRIVTTSSTVYSGGVATDILAGTWLEAEGSLVGGVLIANKIMFEDSVLLQSNATVNGSTITLEGLPGITVTANAFTNFNNTAATAQNLSPLNASGVRIRGRAAGTNSVIATLIQGLNSNNSSAILQGHVATVDVTSPTLKILGVTVDTVNLDNNLDFKDASGQPLNRASFFGALAPGGGTVAVSGSLPASSGNAFDATDLSAAQLVGE